MILLTTTSVCQYVQNNFNVFVHNNVKLTIFSQEFHWCCSCQSQFETTMRWLVFLNCFRFNSIRMARPIISVRFDSRSWSRQRFQFEFIFNELDFDSHKSSFFKLITIHGQNINSHRKVPAIYKTLAWWSGARADLEKQWFAALLRMSTFKNTWCVDL